jgi:xylulose-5-phosphate/fructose-6-phosphate phosphoketolase
VVGYGYRPYVVAGEEPAAMHQAMAATLDAVVEEVRGIQARARSRSTARTRPRSGTGRGTAAPDGAGGETPAMHQPHHHAPSDAGPRPAPGHHQGHAVALKPWILFD